MLVSGSRVVMITIPIFHPTNQLPIKKTQCWLFKGPRPVPGPGGALKRPRPKRPGGEIHDGEVDVKITFIGFLRGVQGEGGGELRNPKDSGREDWGTLLGGSSQLGSS